MTTTSGSRARAERTGYAVLLWLEKEVGTGRWTGPLPEITVHSGNPVGRDRMLQALRTIGHLHETRHGG